MYMGIFLVFSQKKLIQEANAISTLTNVQENGADPQLMQVSLCPLSWGCLPQMRLQLSPWKCFWCPVAH